jgi:hypothetical protein
MFKAKSGQGISFEGLFMDLVSLNVTIGFCYTSGYEFHLYGENVSNIV